MVLIRGVVRRLVIVFVINVTAEDGEQTHRIGLTVVAILQMAGHFDAVLGHDQLVDFFSLPQFFFEQSAVFVGIGNLCTEVVIQLVVGDSPMAVL